MRCSIVFRSSNTQILYASNRYYMLNHFPSFGLPLVPGLFAHFPAFALSLSVLRPPITTQASPHMSLRLLRHRLRTHFPAFAQSFSVLRSSISTDGFCTFTDVCSFVLGSSVSHLYTGSPAHFPSFALGQTANTFPCVCSLTFEASVFH